MQEQVSVKVVVLVINTGKKGLRLTAGILKAAMRKYLQAQEKKKTAKANVKAAKKAEKAIPRGKQTMAQLMKQNQGLTNIEITDKNIKSFERIANKYSIDFSLKKDKYSETPKYFVFFKARDVDVMTAAFKEFSTMELVKSKKPSIQKRLFKYIQKSKVQDKQRERSKQKDRGQER